MKKFLILALSIAIIGSAWGQCTITQPTILNSSVAGGVTTFDLQFKHVRNSGNKWVTLHFWATTAYPSYNYDRVPTTTRLGGTSKKPFGTVVIDNSTVDHSGTYTSTVFASPYQNDGAFVLLNTATSSLVYSSATGLYTLKNLKMTLPAGISGIEYDSWSSQSNDNGVVHCYNTCNMLPIPTVTAVTGLETFQGTAVSGKAHLTWLTHMESNNSHFLVEEYKDGGWYDVAMIVSKYEDGNCSHDTQYECTVDGSTKGVGLAATLPALIVISLLFRGVVPARLTLLAGLAISMGTIACNSQKDVLSDSLQTAHIYKLVQVDKDGKRTDSPHQVSVKF